MLVVVSCGLLSAVTFACGAFASAEAEEDPATDGAAAEDGTTISPLDGGGPDPEAGGDGALPSKDGGDDAAPSLGCNGKVACQRVVFITSAEYVPTALGGVSGAHDKCNQLAAAPTAHPRVKGRAFYAWLSDAKSNPAAFMTKGTGAYVLPSGAPIANNWDALTTEALQNHINQDEKGQLANSSLVIWTGTLATGAQTILRCDDWMDDGSGVSGTVGAANTTTMGDWSDRRNPDTCDQNHRIYCFEKML